LGLCILSRVYQLNIRTPPYETNICACVYKLIVFNSFNTIAKIVELYVHCDSSLINHRDNFTIALQTEYFINKNETFYKSYISPSTIIPLSVDQIPFYSAKLVEIFELTSSFNPVGTSTICHFHWKQEWVGKTFYCRIHNSSDFLLSSGLLTVCIYILYLNSVVVFNYYSFDMNIG
jgi:hypothetical protein